MSGGEPGLSSLAGLRVVELGGRRAVAVPELGADTDEVLGERARDPVNPGRGPTGPGR
jgi:hypothetical protein